MKTNFFKTVLILFVLTFCTSAAFAQLSVSLNVSTYSGYNVSCFGARDGSITANASGGTTPYTYVWSDVAATTTQSMNNLRASYYVVTVTDANNNTATADVTMSEPSQISITLTPSSYPNHYHVSCYQCFNGSINTSVTGGVTPYTYSWLDGPTTQNRSSIGGGGYKVTVTGANGCTAQESITITEPTRDDWTMLGNTGSDPNTHYVGTTDNQDLVFKTNGVERIRIHSNGDIQINDELNVTNQVASRLSVGHILALPGDSGVHFGDSSFFIPTIPPYRMYPTTSNEGGIGIGSPWTTGSGTYSVAIGRNVRVTANEAVVIGNGVGISTNTLFTNAVLNR